MMTTLELATRRPLIGINGEPLVDSRGAILYGANTPGGIPYPSPGDPVAQGAANMQAIAAFLDPALAAASRSATMNMNTGVWSPVATWAATKTIGSGLTVTGAGIAVAFTGRVRVDGYGIMSASAGGTRRGVTVAPTSGLGSLPSPTLLPTGAAQGLAFGFEMDVAAGTTLTTFGFQDSGTSLTMASNTITVRRIP